MSEQKQHKQEKPNKKEPTPRDKKIRDLRASGWSISEIALKLNISRKEAEAPFSKDIENARDAKTSQANKKARKEASDAKQTVKQLDVTNSEGQTPSTGE